MLDLTTVFTSFDRFERITRAEAAEILNSGIAEQHGVPNVKPFEDDGDRLTDEVCYAVVEQWANCGDPVETFNEVWSEHPEIGS